MARASIDVTLNPPDDLRIPDSLVQPVALLLDLERRGMVDAVGERVHIRRQGGYCGLDVWLVLLVYMASGVMSGVKKFWEILRPHNQGIAALAGRRKLPSPAALSRALDAVELDLLRPSLPWLLTGVAQVDGLLRHPVVQSYDCCGRGWHVFDLDPTVTTLRHRALPIDENLPEARRRSEDTGEPGYSGRKRGDIQFRRVTAQHRGSSAWVHAHLSEGNGEGVVDLELALDTMAETCDRLEHPRSRAMVCMDGEYGSVPYFTACRERQLPFITRLNRPALYNNAEVLARLRAATWHLIEDSRSGPQRSAADLGVMTVHADKRTTRPDGSRYGPITVRVVASIFPKRGKAKRGRTIDGWQVELFAVDLPADSWPAPEAITMFFGRNSEENRFAQEDRELELDRIISYHLPGQELATVVGLSLWNMRLDRGVALEPPVPQRPVQPPRQAQVDERVPEHWPRDPMLVQTLARLDWAVLLQRRPQWRWDAETGELRCTDGRILHLTTIRNSEHAPGRTGIIFRRPIGGCEDCAPRDDCFRSEREGASKHVEFAIPTAIAEQLGSRLDQVRNITDTIGVVGHTPGSRAATGSLFLPTNARHAFNACFLRATVRIVADIPPPERYGLHLVADDVADRQRRRKTWEENIARHSLPEGARVQIDVRGKPELRRLVSGADTQTQLCKAG